jgi:hypothetical protein
MRYGWAGSPNAGDEQDAQLEQPRVVGAREPRERLRAPVEVLVARPLEQQLDRLVGLLRVVRERADQRVAERVRAVGLRVGADRRGRGGPAAGDLVGGGDLDAEPLARARALDVGREVLGRGGRGQGDEGQDQEDAHRGIVTARRRIVEAGVGHRAGGGAAATRRRGAPRPF